jgi:sec-independent protein translocase protein TatC
VRLEEEVFWPVRHADASFVSPGFRDWLRAQPALAFFPDKNSEAFPFFKSTPHSHAVPMLRFLSVALNHFSRSLRSRGARVKKGDSAADAQPEESAEEREMGFFEHIEELRSMLLRCIAAFTVSMVVAFCYAKEIFAFMRRPLQKALESGAAPPPPPPVSGGADPLEIVNALAGIIFYGVIPPSNAISGAAATADTATAELLATASGESMVVMKFMDVFSILLNIGFVGGIALSGPFVLYFASRFVGPALTPSEKKCVIPFCGSSMFLFVGGCVFSFCWLIPVSIGVMFHFVRMFGLKMPWLASDYYSFVTMMTLLVGFAFQFPLVVIVLQYLEIIQTSTLFRVWRQVLVGILVTSLVISPLADPVSLSVLTGVLFSLYLLAVAVGGLLVRAKQKKRAEEELEYERTYGRKPAAATPALADSGDNTASADDDGDYTGGKGDGSEYYGADADNEVSEYSDDGLARYDTSASENTGEDTGMGNEDESSEEHTENEDNNDENNGDEGEADDEETGDGKEAKEAEETAAEDNETTETSPQPDTIPAAKEKPKGDLELVE